MTASTTLSALAGLVVRSKVDAQASYCIANGPYISGWLSMHVRAGVLIGPTRILKRPKAGEQVAYDPAEYCFQQSPDAQYLDKC